MDSNRKPKNSRSATSFAGDARAPRAATASEGSTKWRTGVERSVVRERRCGDQAGWGSTTISRSRASRYPAAVSAFIAVPSPPASTASLANDTGVARLRARDCKSLPTRTGSRALPSRRGTSVGRTSSSRTTVRG